MCRSTRVVIGALLTAAAAVLVGACGGDSSAGGEDEVKIMYLLPTLSDEAYSREASGAESEAATTDDVELEIVAGERRSDVATQVSRVENAVTQQFDAIIVDPGEFVDQLSPVVAAAQGEGIKVVTVVQELPDVTADAAITFDQEKAYAPAGEFMSEQLANGGEIGIITCIASNADSQARIRGFKGALDSNVKEVAFGDAKCDPAQARSITENMLTANPGLDGIFNNTDLATVGTIEALKAAGEDLVVIGGDGQTPNLRFMADGEIQDAAPRYPSETLGEAGVSLAVGLARGEDVPAETEIEPLPLITQENAAEVLEEIESLGSTTATGDGS